MASPLRSQPRITDVAALAGVSTSTASKALNDTGQLREETRERVRRAAEQLGFTPDSRGRALSSGRSFTVGLITTDSSGRFSIPIMLGAEDALSAGEMALVLCDTRDDPLREQHYLKSLVSRRVDGIIVTGRRTQARPPIATDLPAPASQAPAESEKLAVLTSTEPAQVEAAKPEAPAKEASAETPIAPPSATATEAPAPNAEVQIAAIAATPEPASVLATSPEPAADIPPFEGSIATTLIATLGGPAVIIEEKVANARPDRSVLRQRAAQRARERRRMLAARRARLAREAVLTLQQQQPNPFTPFPGMPATR